MCHQAGGVFNNRTNLNKAFYHAHLFFARRKSGYLSEWPIVRLPRRPDIMAPTQLVNELFADGTIKVDYVPCGRKFRFRYTLVKSDFDSGLSPEEVEAISRVWSLSRMSRRNKPATEAMKCLGRGTAAIGTARRCQYI